MNKQELREKFEEFAKYNWVSPELVWNEKSKCYEHHNTIDDAWQGFKACYTMMQDTMKDAERYNWILHQAKITDFIFSYLKSNERHISNAIDTAIAKEKKDE